MISRNYPHYLKLCNILDKNQIEIYKKLTPNLSLNRLFDINTKLSVLKYSEKVVVLKYKSHVIKVLFKDPNKCKSEIYFTHLFLKDDIYSMVNQEGSMIILPYYGNNLRNYSQHFSINTLKYDCAVQILKLHCDYIVHHDIKPSNIVKNQNKHTNQEYSWKIIDFGISRRHIPGIETGQLPFDIGTRSYNIPTYTFYDNTYQNEKLFWIYMKDWYGFSKTIFMYGEHQAYDLQSYIENMNSLSIIDYLNTMTKDFNIDDLPYYMTQQSEHLEK